MKRMMAICAGVIAATTVASHSRSNPSVDVQTNNRLLDSITIAYGAGIRINDAGQVLVSADVTAPGVAADSTFVWSESRGLRELRFDGTTAVTRGVALSQSGYVAGQAVSPRGVFEGFIWSESLGIHLVSPDPVMENATVVAVNDDGEVVGVDVGMHSAYRATVSRTSRGHPLGPDSAGCASNATAISHWGESIGASTLDAAGCKKARDAAMHAYLRRRDGTAVDLGTLGGARSQALAVNDRGQVAGWSEDVTGRKHAFLWAADTGMLDLGILSGRSSEATALNNSGQVTGIVQSGSGETHSFVWSAATRMIDIGPGAPTGINDLGQIAGTSATADNSTAFFWSPDSGRLVLADDARALAINNRGAVVGGTGTIGRPEAAIEWRLSLTDAERINWYEGRTAVLEYGHLIPAAEAAVYRELIADARDTLRHAGRGDSTNTSLALLAIQLGEPGSPLPSTATLATPAATTVPAASSAAYNLKIVTDASPDLSDLSSFITSTTSRWPLLRDKVWALFYWSHVLKRQTPPMIRHGWEMTDPIRNFTDFGYTQCSTISGINQSLYEVLGLRHQFWDICQHSVSAVEYDGSFHLIDSSMSNLVTTDDGRTLASVQEAAADSARLVRQHSLYSSSPDGFLTGSDTSRNLTDFPVPTGGTLDGFSNDFCQSRLSLRSYYYNWDSGHRYVLNLRDNEAYTRYYRPLGSTPDYWVGAEDSADPTQTWEIDPENRFGLRGNGSWSFTPDLGAAGYARAAYRTVDIAPSDTGGLQPKAPAVTADVVYKVQAADVIASQNIHAQFSRTDVSATATIAVSLNHGLTWADVASVGSALGNAIPVVASLRNQVNGAYDSLVRVRMTAGGASTVGIVLTALRIDTVTQVNAKALPKLNIGRNQVYVGAGDQSDSMVLWPDLRRNLWQKDAYQYANVTAQAAPINGYSAVLYPADPTQVAFVTYRMDAPTDITRMVYGGRLYNRATNASIDFLHSFDNGANWIPSYHFAGTSAPYDVIHYETVTDIPPGVRTVLFKYQIQGSDWSHPSGLFAVRMEADHTPPAGGSKPVDVTFRWKEVRADRALVDRSYKQHVATFPSTYTIDVGGSDHPIMESLTVNVEGSGDGAAYGYSDGIDVGGLKFVDSERTDGTNLAVGRSYTFSRSPSGFQYSAPETNHTILTDGVVGAPTTGGFTYWWGQCWNPGELDIDVDLGQQQTVSAFRAHVFGYPPYDALRGTFDDRVQILTSTDRSRYDDRGDMPMSVWRKDIPINYMLQDDETATGWNFEYRLGASVPARYVRYHFTSNRILCASELQVFDHIDYRPFDIRIALPDDNTPPPTDIVPPTVALTAPQNGSTVSGAITLAASASDNVGVARVDFVVDGVLVASDATAPYSTAWDSSVVGNGAHIVAAQASDTAGNSSVSTAASIMVANAIPATPVPGTVQAEDFDNGVEGVAYHDATPGNSGGGYRDTDVDIEPATDSGGGYNIGWITAGEWLRYAINVATAGSYTVAFRVASPDVGGTFHLEANGTDVTGPLTIPKTGTWQTWTTVARTGIVLAAGPQAFRLVMDTNGPGGTVGNFNWVRFTAGAPGSTPFKGTPSVLPGTFQAEDFDEGGPEVAYHDTSSQNSGGMYRQTDVDIQPTTDAGGGNNVGWVSTGEWLNYTVSVATAGTYTLAIRVASRGAGGTFHLEANSTDITGSLTVPDTGDWQAWTTVQRTGVSLAAGTQVLRLVMDNEGASGAVGNFNWVLVSAPMTNSTPFTGTPVALPGTFQAEDFDEGGPEVAYHDTTAENSGGMYRQTGVDIEPTADGGGGYNIGWMSAGEWLNYTVSLAATGTYTVQVRVASPAAGGTFHLESNGIDITGPLSVPDTGSWKTWTTITRTNIVLAAGVQTLRLVMDTEGATGAVGNFNWVRVIAAATGSTPFTGTPIALPGAFQAEDFDEGGAEIAYHDNSSQNSGGMYRQTGVDIEATSDTGGGYNVGWMSAGEWLNYTVSIAAAGAYAMDVRVASPGVGGTFHVESNGIDVTGTLTIPNTGGWQNWTSVSANIVLPEGEQILRFVMDSNGATGSVGNINWAAVRTLAGEAARVSMTSGAQGRLLPSAGRQ
jgi:probable HAF family extracellular repeat protein